MIFETFNEVLTHLCKIGFDHLENCSTKHRINAIAHFDGLAAVATRFGRFGGVWIRFQFFSSKSLLQYTKESNVHATLILPRQHLKAQPSNGNECPNQDIQ
ncbi:MAG: hypothetical protein HZB47_00130 [Nitrosomonadales bacterium]|nr:hypothetical protein [Nitrosomonadales bacterium]